MSEALEQHEQSEHLAHGGGGLHGSRFAALAVAVLAAGLALSEQGARHAELRVQQNAIAATDAWAQYQAKSTRAATAREMRSVVAALEPASPDAKARREQAIELLTREQDRFENDPKDGKDAVAARARNFERERDHALEQTHAYHNGSAAMQLAIVLATASAIIGSRLLITMALIVGVAGLIFALLGWVAPGLGAV
jgi:Domain of unknown function (DUF4337)